MSARLDMTTRANMTTKVGMGTRVGVRASHCSAIALIAVAAMPVLAEEERAWSVDLDATAGYDDNVGRGLFERDIVGEYVGNVAASFNYDFELDPRMALTLRVLAESESHEVVKPLERVTGGGEAIFRWQGEFGFFEPFYQLSFRLQDDNFGVDQRDATVYNLHIQRTQRLNASWTYLLGAEYRNTDSDGTVFDLSQSRLFGNLDYRIDPDWVAYGTLSYAVGDAYSTAQNRFCNDLPATDIYPLVVLSDAIEPDQAFNETFCGSWLAYRAEANTLSLSVGLNRAFADTYSFDVSVMNIRSAASDDTDLYYDRQIARISVLMRF